MNGKMPIKQILSVLALLFLTNPAPAISEEKSGQPAPSGDFQTHLNGGVWLAKCGKAEEALVELKKAAALKPDDQLVLVNLGQAYQLCGKNVEALEQYKKYMTLYPDGPHVAQITSMFDAMQKQVLLAGGKSSQGMDNYLAEALAPGGGRWGHKLMPLRVFVADGAGIEGYRDTFPDVFKKALADWCAASQGKVSVKYVSDQEQANIVCRWTANIKDLANPAEGGQAFVQLTAMEHAVVKADILLLTHNDTVPAVVTPANYMRSICLHEIGHALGMPGHSSQAGDIMFAVMNFGTTIRDLSDRDKKTILDLYSRSSVPGSANSSQAVQAIMQVKPGAKKK